MTVSLPSMRTFLALLLFSTTAAFAAPRTFAVDSDASTATAHVGKTGIGSFAGHDHVVVAPLMRGEVVADLDDLTKSSVSVDVNARALKVSPEGEPDGDAVKVQDAMKGRKVLDTVRFGIINFSSRQVSGKRTGPEAFELSIAGELSLHGVHKPVTVPVQLQVHGDALTASGKLVVKQTAFGIEPTSAAGGLVKAADDVELTFKIVARAR